jgi:hypothetical protein
VVLPEIRPPNRHGCLLASSPLEAPSIKPGAEYREDAKLTGCMWLRGRPCLKLAGDRIALECNVIRVILFFVIKIAILLIFILVKLGISVDMMVTGHIDQKCGSRPIRLLCSYNGMSSRCNRRDTSSVLELEVDLGSTNPMLLLLPYTTRSFPAVDPGRLAENA